MRSRQGARSATPAAALPPPPHGAARTAERQPRPQRRRHRWQVEGVQGEAKSQHASRRAVRRYPSSIPIQAYLTAAGLKLKRLAPPAFSDRSSPGIGVAVSRAWPSLSFSAHDHPKTPNAVAALSFNCTTGAERRSSNTFTVPILFPARVGTQERKEEDFIRLLAHNESRSRSRSSCRRRGSPENGGHSGRSWNRQCSKSRPGAP